MSIKNILIAYNGGASSQNALNYAASLSQKTKPHLTAMLIHARMEDYATLDRWLTKETRAIIEASNQQVTDEALRAFDAQVKEAEFKTRVSLISEEGRVDDRLSRAARSYDILIIGDVSESMVDEHLAIHPDQIALRSGKPILIVPRQYEAQPKTSHKVIAWDGKRACARALADAMDILETGGEISLITVGDTKLPRPIDEVMTHLARHDIPAKHFHLDVNGSIAQTILNFCEDNDATMLVMGAYEHSKFRVDLLGGITSEILAKAEIPVLISH